MAGQSDICWLVYLVYDSHLSDLLCRAGHLDRESIAAWLVDTWIGILLGSALVWSSFAHVYEWMLYVRVEVHRLTSPTLFGAVTKAASKEAEEIGQSCSRDHEARQEHDSITGNFSVKLRFWSSSRRELELLIHTRCSGDD